MYETMVLIDVNTKLELSCLHDAITKALSSSSNPPSIVSTNGKLTIKWEDFTLKVNHSTEEHVLIEAAELARIYAEDHPHRKEIAACSERLDISATADNAMNHFNDYCFVLGAIEKIGRVYTFSSAGQEFVNLAAQA